MNGPTAEVYLTKEGTVFTWVNPGYSGMAITEDVPPLYAPGGNYNSVLTDGHWHSVPQPLTVQSVTWLGSAIHASTVDNDWYLVITDGPAMTEASKTRFIPGRYKTVAIPRDITRKIAIGNADTADLTAVTANDHDEMFWKAHGPRAWKHIAGFLPSGLPKWELEEAREVFIGAKTVGWMSGPALTSTRRRFFENRLQYYTLMGRTESAEEREQRLYYGKDARLMSAFYRAVSAPTSKVAFLKKTKVRSAIAIANAYEAGHVSALSNAVVTQSIYKTEADAWIAEQYANL